MKRPNFQGFLSDFYRDVRDRRLLLPIAALAVAILAVPMLLGGSSESAPPPAPAPVDASIGAEVDPAVLVAEPGVRNYRKRLAELKKTNPFVQQFTKSDPEAAALESVVPEEDAGAAAAATSGVTDTGASISTIPDTSVSSGSTGTGTTAPDVPPTDTTVDTEPADEPKPEVRFYVGRVDVTFGQAGDRKTYEGVRELDLIPNDKQPMIGFIGLAGNGQHAVFSLSADVVETSGDGSCAPKKPDPCQFLRLAEGDERKLEFANGKTFVLKLVETHLVRVPDPRDQK